MPEPVIAPVYGGIWIDKFTRLLLQAWAVPVDLEVHLCGRTLLESGERNLLCYDYKLTGVAAKDEFYAVPSPGLLESINLYMIGGASSYGDIFVQLSLLHGRSAIDMAHRIIIQGYIGGDTMRGFPDSSLDPP